MSRVFPKFVLRGAEDVDIFAFKLKDGNKNAYDVFGNRVSLKINLSNPIKVGKNKIFDIR